MTLMRTSFLLSIAASALATACASNPSPAVGTGSDDAGSKDGAATAAAGDGSVSFLSPEAGDSDDAGTADAACTAFPGCVSNVSCAAGDGCSTCTCAYAFWECPIQDCAEAGVEAGTDAGVCPPAAPTAGNACAAPDGVLCVYGKTCPLFEYLCADGGWQEDFSGANLCPPPNP